VTLSTLASEVDVTPFVLLRAFVREAGLSPHAFQQRERVRNAMPVLREARSIPEVGARTGFADQSHFTRLFKQQNGVTPKVCQAAFFINHSANVCYRYSTFLTVIDVRERRTTMVRAHPFM
jgi:AraC-like DNA-binding protein